MKTLAKDAYDALDTDLKNLYQEKDGAYHLSAVPRSVNNGILDAKRKAEEEANALRQRYGDLDPDAAKKAIEAQRAAEQDRAVKAGEFEKVLGQTKAEAKAEADKIKAEYDAKIAALNGSLSIKLRDEELLRAAIAAGVQSEFHDDVLLHGKEAFEVVDGKLKPKGHEHETVDKWLKDKLSKKKGWLGPSTGGGTGKDDTGSGIQRTGLKRSEMTHEERGAYQKKYGMPAYNKLPRR